MARFRRQPDYDPDQTRMSIGEHLDELRRCVAHSLVALFVACLACIWPSKYLLEIIARPVVIALRRHGQPDSFLATSPAENLLVYVKVVLIFGLLLAAPYILYKLWTFIAAGLYPRERAWVLRLLPVSIGLFVVGVLFMYCFVLIMSLNFLVGFSGWLPLPTAEPTALERLMLQMPHVQAPASQPASAPATVPLLERDPPDPPVGSIWINLNDGKLKVRWPDAQTYSVQVLRDDRRALVTTHFRIGEYLSFVLVLTIAFGLAFQTPLVVVFLARTGVVPVATFRKYRKFVILIVILIAGMLSPPDLISHLLLSGPMLLLFELGVFMAARGKYDPPRRPAPATAAASGAAPPSDSAPSADAYSPPDAAPPPPS